jgi:hypothetical protein
MTQHQPVFHNNCKVESPTTDLDLTLTHILFIFISFWAIFMTVGVLCEGLQYLFEF